jgi:hypothetical protein
VAKTRDILVHALVETADRQRRCHANATHAIRSGETCLVIRGRLPNDRKNYCRACASKMLKLAGQRLRELTLGVVPAD